ncbi:MAG TPA: serine/threonine-protein kinase, partial [Iamia sp.]
MSDGPSLSKGGVAIPGYEVERELGRGGFAVVYRANQPKLRRTVALKVLTNVDPSDEDAKRRFEAECQAIGSLSWHPHVVTVYDAGQTEEGLPFLAMENLPSGSLQAKLADHGPAPWEEVLRVTVQMCDALGAAHQAGILHRDIKPANVLTSRIGDYKLADFGIARFGDTQRTATGVITGTVAYTAPEVLRGARASAASDIYALGAMLCAVGTGKTPFVKEADESVVAIMYRVNTEDPPPFDDYDIPDDLGLLIHTLMDKDPEKRPASALEVAQWAQHIQEQHGIASAPLHTDPDMEPGLPAAAIAAGAAALGAGAGAATTVVSPASPAPAAPPST